MDFLNWATLYWLIIDQSKKGIENTNSKSDAPFGISLNVNKSEVNLQEQLKAICNSSVDFIITSIGSPKDTLTAAHQNDVEVFYGVAVLYCVQKAQKLTTDAGIAAKSNIGGSIGKILKTNWSKFWKNKLRF